MMLRKLLRARKKICQIMAVVLMGTLISSTAVFAAENDEEVLEDNIIKETEFVMNVPISECSDIVGGVEEMEIALASSTTGDAYEPNDTKETAYNYNAIPEMNDYLYNMGYKNASLHTVTDEDWYYTTLTAGVNYFLDLRNIGSDDFNISLIHYNSNNTVDIISSIDDETFSGRPEKYYYFTSPKSGTYYVRITGDGEHTTSLNYFFYIDKAERTFTCTRNIGVGVSILGSSYGTQKLMDLTETVFPKNSTIISMSLTDSFSGKYCSECQKKVISSSGKVYYSSAGDEEISGVEGCKLDQRWYVTARCTTGTHMTTWAPKLVTKFSCKMQPFPGNEVE